MESNQMNGFFNCFKPAGMTSSAVVLAIKKILGVKKVGHLGTLDMAASGVLPIAVGTATKYFQYFLTKHKKYFAIFRFGIETTTLDRQGEVLFEKQVKIEKGQVEKALENFIGEID